MKQEIKEINTDLSKDELNYLEHIDFAKKVFEVFTTKLGIPKKYFQNDNLSKM